jgi:uncharacterized protein YndB with AHSA1/START domain
MESFTHQLERTVVIQATPETVFRFFTDSPRWAKWWGEGSTIDARVGGKVLIRHPGGKETVGEILEIAPPQRIVFTYGFTSGKPVPPGASRVTISLHPDEEGTRLHLLHQFADAAARDEHVQGWMFQLSLFANIVANEAFANVADTADAWFAAWAIPEEKARAAAFAKIALPAVRFRDRFSLLNSLAEVTAHAGAAQRFMPGVRMERKGGVRHCQGTVLADFVAQGPDGKERMSGTNVFVLAPDGRISTVTGIANPPAGK